MSILPQIHTKNLESTDKQEVASTTPKATYPINLIPKSNKVNFAAMLSAFTGYQNITLFHKKLT